MKIREKIEIQWLAYDLIQEGFRQGEASVRELYDIEKAAYNRQTELLETLGKMLNDDDDAEAKD